MPHSIDPAEARRALLEKYLRGDLPKKDTATEIDVEDVLSQPIQTGEVHARARAVPIQTAGTQRPFFYLHGDWNGKIFYCYPLAKALGEDQPFYLLDPYNFDGLAVPPRFEDMVAAHIKTMRSIQAEGPYMLGGWCNGGLIAYEMTLQLLKAGQQVDVVLLLDADYPAMPHLRKLRRNVNLLGKVLHLSARKQLDLFLLYKHMRSLFHFWRVKDYARLRGVIKLGEWDKRQGLARLKLPSSEVLRRDWAGIYEWSAAAYTPATYPGRVTFLWDEVDLWRRVGWRDIVAAKGSEVETYIMTGNHFTCRTDYLHILANYVAQAIKEGHTPLA
ncbi:MAG: thioesterase domain-containing protein [Chloroflexota bacterium]|nr:thioesterase domain-containing protein [Chloroflexota bacterium]